MKQLKTILIGVGQIFLQENYLSGLIIVIAMFFSHWALGLSCILGSLIGTLTAQILRFSKQQIEQGLYGFNASLSFMCVIFTFGLVDANNPIIWILGVAGAIISTLIMYIFLKNNKIAFTFPFVLTCWVLCYGVAKLGLFGLAQTALVLPSETNAISNVFYAWSQVNFSQNLITGILICLAVAVSSPLAAITGIAAANIGAIFAYYVFGVDLIDIANGIYGFSPILVACALCGSTFSSIVFVVIGTILAVIIQYFIALSGLSTYTIGFILACWIILFFKMKFLSKVESK